MKNITIRIWDELVDSYNNATDDIEIEDAQYTAAKYGERLVDEGCNIKKLIGMMNKRDVIKIYPAIKRRTGKPWPQLLDYYKQDQDFVYSHIKDFLACDLTYDEIVMHLTKRIEYRKVSYLCEFIDGGASYSTILKVIEKCSDSNTQWECGYRTEICEVLKKLLDSGCEAKTIEEWLMNLHPRYWKWIFESYVSHKSLAICHVISVNLARRYWLELFGHNVNTNWRWNTYTDYELIKAYFKVRGHQRSRWTNMTRIGDIKPLSVETDEKFGVVADEETGIVNVFTRNSHPSEDWVKELKEKVVSMVDADWRKLINYTIDLCEGSIMLEFSNSRETRSSKTRKAFFDTLGINRAG